MRLATYDGNIYALPFNAEGSILLWNKDLFEQAGLDPETPPTNWGEIAAASEQITALGDDIYRLLLLRRVRRLQRLHLPAPDLGQRRRRADRRRPDRDHGPIPTWPAALDFYRQLWESGQMPPGAQADTGSDFANAFTTGKIGMVGSGAFAISMLKNDYPDIDFGVTYLPGAGGRRLLLCRRRQHRHSLRLQVSRRGLRVHRVDDHRRGAVDAVRGGQQPAGAHRPGRQRVLPVRPAL